MTLLEKLMELNVQHNDVIIFNEPEDTEVPLVAIFREDFKDSPMLIFSDSKKVVEPDTAYRKEIKQIWRPTINKDACFWSPDCWSYGYSLNDPILVKTPWFILIYDRERDEPKKIDKNVELEEFKKKVLEHMNKSDYCLASDYFLLSKKKLNKLLNEN